MKGIEEAEEKMKGISAMLNLLIEQPQTATSLTKLDIENVWLQNVLKVRLVEIWANGMREVVEDKIKDKQKIRDFHESFDKIIKVSYK